MAIGTPISLGTADGTGTAVLSGLSVTGGNTIIVITGKNYSYPDGNSTIYNDGSDNYAMTEVAYGANSSRANCVIWVLYNAPGSSGSGSITYTHNNSGKDASICAYEVSGLQISGFDKSAGAGDSSASFDSGATATTTENDELVIGGASFSGTVSSWTGTITDGTQDSGGHAKSAYKIVSSTGTYNSAGNLDSKDYWAAAVATFKASSATPDTFLTGVTFYDH